MLRAEWVKGLKLKRTNTGNYFLVQKNCTINSCISFAQFLGKREFFLAILTGPDLIFHFAIFFNPVPLPSPRGLFTKKCFFSIFLFFFLSLFFYISEVKTLVYILTVFTGHCCRCKRNHACYLSSIQLQPSFFAWFPLSTNIVLNKWASQLVHFLRKVCGLHDQSHTNI